MRHFTSNDTDQCHTVTVHQPSSYSISRATSIDWDCCRPPTASVLSNKADKSYSVSINESSHTPAGKTPTLIPQNQVLDGEGTRYFSLVVVVVVVVDSHIQRIVLATEETTVTQQVSHRPIKRQSRLWSQRGTKVNGSHHGDNPLLRPTGIQIATKRYAALQAMAPTNIKTVHQTSLLHSRATSIDSECCRLPTTSVLSKKPEKLRSNQF